MKKFLLGLPFVLFSNFLFADCKVFVPEKTFLHTSGYSISFDFTKMLSEKGYTEVFSVDEASGVLELAGNEIEERLHKAEGTLKLGDLMVSERVTCFTQYCAISDYAKAFNKVYKKFSKQLPACR